jgi:hypothetical protein
MNAKVTYYLFLLVILVVSIGSSIIGPMMNISISKLINKQPKETFISPGKYPLAVTKPILYNSYNTKKNPGVSAYSSSDIISDYPIFPASSCQNNNIRYWRRPNNGTCSPADFCGGIYKSTEQDIPSTLQPPLDQGVRVNYYDSES